MFVKNFAAQQNQYYAGKYFNAAGGNFFQKTAGKETGKRIDKSYTADNGGGNENRRFDKIKCDTGGTGVDTGGNADKKQRLSRQFFQRLFMIFVLQGLVNDIEAEV